MTIPARDLDPPLTQAHKRPAPSGHYQAQQAPSKRPRVDPPSRPPGKPAGHHGAQLDQLGAQRRHAPAPLISKYQGALANLPNGGFKTYRHGSTAPQFRAAPFSRTPQLAANVAATSRAASATAPLPAPAPVPAPAPAPPPATAPPEPAHAPARAAPQGGAGTAKTLLWKADVERLGRGYYGTAYCGSPAQEEATRMCMRVVQWVCW
jgi:hypothetical protein